MRSENVVLTNMCMVYKDDQVLVLRRRKSWPGLAFPGGHIEEDEHGIPAVIREVQEETGLLISDVELCGMKQYWANGIRQIIFFYKSNNFTGEIKSSAEGDVFWMSRDELYNSDELAELFQSTLDLYFEKENIQELVYTRDRKLLRY